jgi:hypothetical protein
MFEGLDPSEVATVAAAMVRVDVPACEHVIRQGTDGDRFYIVAEGSLSVVVNGKHTGQLTAGSHFGELALMFNCPRNADVVSETACVLWALDREVFRTIIVTSAARVVHAKIAFLQSVTILASLPPRHLYRIAEVSSIETYDNGDLIVEQGAGPPFVCPWALCLCCVGSRCIVLLLFPPPLIAAAAATAVCGCVAAAVAATAVVVCVQTRRVQYFSS